MKKLSSAGFTLVELMVVISIIGILSAIVYANFGSARASSRDAERKSDIRNLQTAIELYKKQYNRYPVQGCGSAGVTMASEKACGATPYITGLAPEFMSVLPRDPGRGTAEGYSYLTNTNGTVFKVMAQNTVETEVVTATSQFRSCDVGASGLCPLSGVCAPTNDRFKKSYGAWGGYADAANDAAVKTATALILCQ